MTDQDSPDAFALRRDMLTPKIGLNPDLMAWCFELGDTKFPNDASSGEYVGYGIAEHVVKVGMGEIELPPDLSDEHLAGYFMDLAMTDLHNDDQIGRQAA